MTNLNLNENELNRIANKFNLEDFEKNQLKRILSPNIRIKFLKPSSESFKQEVLIGKELLKCNKYHSFRMPLLEKVVQKLDLSLATFSKKMNFDILKQYGLVKASHYADPNQGWIELNGLGQAYFSLLFGDEDKVGKDKSKEELQKIIKYQEEKIDRLEKRVGDVLELESKLNSIKKILNDR